MVKRHFEYSHSKSLSEASWINVTFLKSLMLFWTNAWTSLNPHPLFPTIIKWGGFLSRSFSQALISAAWFLRVSIVDTKTQKSSSIKYLLCILLLEDFIDGWDPNGMYVLWDSLGSSPLSWMNWSSSFFVYSDMETKISEIATISESHRENLTDSSGGSVFLLW